MLPLSLKGKKNMKKTFHSSLLAVASLAVIAFAATPASAAKMKAVGCSSDAIAKAEAMVDGMPDTDTNKQTGYKEMTDANEALVSGKMGECAMHLNKVMHMTPAKPAS
jgi:hypothetical protein